MQPIKKQLNLLQSLWQLFKSLFQYAIVDRWLLLLAAVFTLGITISNTVIIWLLGTPIDLIQQEDFSSITTVLSVFVLVVFLNQAFHLGNAVLSHWLGLRFVGRLRSALFSKVLQLSHLALRRFEKGDLLARLSDDVAEAEQFVVETPLDLVSHVFTFIFYSAMLFWIDAELALIVFVFSPLLLLHQRYFAARKRRVSQKFYDKSGMLLGYEENALGNLQGISSYSAEDIMSRSQKKVFEKFKYWGMRDKWLDSTFFASFNLLIYLPAAVIIYVGIGNIHAGSITLGHLVSFLLYLGYLSMPIRGFAELPFAAQGSAAAAERIINVFNTLPEVIEKQGAKPLQVSHGEINIRNVDFSYLQGQPIFNGINIQIHAGETVALVGRSGTGKTTMVKLLMRFYDPVQGSISIDNQNLRDIKLSSLRDNISVVWQEPFLINASIRDNLQLACPNADQDSMIAACQACQAWDFIKELESGLDTVIGTGGINLSTGQCQRISLAQAFLRDAPILFLDEVSSALDSQTESKLIESIERFCHERTTLIIAHRYSTIRSADRIVYLNEDGTVVIGKHEYLLKTHPYYAEAIRWQTDQEKWENRKVDVEQRFLKVGSE